MFTFVPARALRLTLALVFAPRVAGLVLPAVPLLPSLGAALVGGAAVFGVRKAQRDQAAFFSINWADAPADDDSEGCVILGEETIPNGKTWWVCSEKSDDPSMECSPVQGWGNPDGMNDDGWLCKEGPASARKCARARGPFCSAPAHVPCPSSPCRAHLATRTGLGTPSRPARACVRPSAHLGSQGPDIRARERERVWQGGHRGRAAFGRCPPPSL